MQKQKMLVLTDHSGHSKENSLYSLVLSMRRHPSCAHIDIATRGENSNDPFFQYLIPEELYVSEAGEDFAFHPKGHFVKRNLRPAYLKDYDVVWLRMPPPIPVNFLRFLKQAFPDQLIINDPAGIYETGTKEFLLRFPDLCPPMQVCRSVESIIEFKSRFPVVLKPLREYGGKGIVRIDGDQVWEGHNKTTLDHFLKKISRRDIEYLGVKFLKNVSQGDKRIIVVSGEIMGASLRLPAQDSWICNVAMGGRSSFIEVDEEEKHIIDRIHPVLSDLGIVMYGVDTLVGDDGKRVLSEINTTSIGGLPQTAQQAGKPLVERAVDLIWNHITEKKYGRSAN
jgi:glutathione synthase